MSIEKSFKRKMQKAQYRPLTMPERSLRFLRCQSFILATASLTFLLFTAASIIFWFGYYGNKWAR